MDHLRHIRTDLQKLTTEQRYFSMFLSKIRNESMSAMHSPRRQLIPQPRTRRVKGFAKDSSLKKACQESPSRRVDGPLYELLQSFSSGEQNIQQSGTPGRRHNSCANPPKRLVERLQSPVSISIADVSNQTPQRL